MSDQINNIVIVGGGNGCRMVHRENHHRHRPEVATSISHLSIDAIKEEILCLTK